MLLHNFQCRSYNKNRLLMIPSMMLGLGFSSPIPASGSAPPIICVTTNDGKCVMQNEGAIGGDGGTGGNSVGTSIAGSGRNGGAAKVNNPIPQSSHEPSPQALEVQVNYVYRKPEDNSQPQPLTKDSVLQSGDGYKIVFTPAQLTWVYIFQTDSSGKMFQLFPKKEMLGVTMNQFNPVAAGETRTVPLANAWFRLDKQVGTETLYFITTPQQDQELEARYQNYEQMQTSGSSAGMLAQTALNQSLAGRGPAEIAFDESPAATPYTVTTETGQSFTLNAGYLNERCNNAGGCTNVLKFQHQ